MAELTREELIADIKRKLSKAEEDPDYGKKLAASLYSIASGVTAGLTDITAPALATAAGELGEKLGLTEEMPASERYQTAAKSIEELKSEAPHIAGINVPEAAGMVVGAGKILKGAKAAAGMVAPEATELATKYMVSEAGKKLLPRAGAMAAEGAVMQAPFTAVSQAKKVASGESPDLGEAATEIGAGAAIGGALPVIGSGIKKVAKPLATKALSVISRVPKEVVKNIIENPGILKNAKGPEEVIDQITGWAFNVGKMGGEAQKTREKVATALVDIWGRLSSHAGRLKEEARKTLRKENVRLNVDELVAAMAPAQKLFDIAKKPAPFSGSKAAERTLRNTVDYFFELSNRKGQINGEDAHKLMDLLDENINWARRGELKQDSEAVLKEARNAIRRELGVSEKFSSIYEDLQPIAEFLGETRNVLKEKETALKYVDKVARKLRTQDFTAPELALSGMPPEWQTGQNLMDLTQQGQKSLEKYGIEKPAVVTQGELFGKIGRPPEVGYQMDMEPIMNTVSDMAAFEQAQKWTREGGGPERIKEMMKAFSGENILDDASRYHIENLSKISGLDIDTLRLKMKKAGMLDALGRANFTDPQNLVVWTPATLGLTMLGIPFPVAGLISIMSTPAAKETLQFLANSSIQRKVPTIPSIIKSTLSKESKDILLQGLIGTYNAMPGDDEKTEIGDPVFGKQVSDSIKKMDDPIEKARALTDLHKNHEVSNKVVKDMLMGEDQVRSDLVKWVTKGGGLPSSLGEYVSQKMVPNMQEEPQTPSAEEAPSEVPDSLLKALIDQESGGDPNAINPKSGAAGIAQFMKPTAKEMGLQVDGKDERMNPHKAVPAAGKYLQKLYDMFGSWDLALAAYNWGPGNVRKHLASGGKIDTMPRETREYVTNILSNSGMTPEQL